MIKRLKAYFNGQAESVETVTVRLQVDDVASATVSVLQPERRVNRVLGTDALDAMRTQQVARLRGTTETDQYLELTDGDGVKMSMKAFRVAPAIEGSYGRNLQQRGLAGMDAILNALDLSHYLGREVVKIRDEEVLPSLKSGNIPLILKELTEKLVATHAAAVAEERNDVMKKVMEQTHTNNEPALKAWYAMLEQSDATLPLLSRLFELPQKEDIKTNIVESVTQLLQQKTNFWGIIRALMDHFKMSYIPSTDGHGYFILRDTKVDQETRQTIVLGAEGLSLNDGSSTVLQLGGVVMTGNGSDSAPKQRDEEITSDSVAAMYPEKFLPGYIDREPLPVWLPDASILDTPEEPPKELVYDLGSYVAKHARKLVRQKLLNKGYNEFLVDMCRIAFTDKQLASARATVRLPLSLRVLVGVRTTFKTKSGSTITGFVETVTHSVSLTEGKNLSSSTTLNVTHVRF